MRNIQGNIFCGIYRADYCDGQEGATKIEQVQKNEEFWLFCNNVKMNVCPP